MRNHSFPLGFSPYPPVSVSGTEPIQLILEVFLGGLFRWVDQENLTFRRLLHDVIKDSYTDLPI